jgi:shikimate kinase
MKIYIVGFMGSGKSTFAKEIAEAIGFGFIDLDDEIEKNEKKSISELFTEKGEDYFRKAEHEALLKTEDENHTIIATGGGTACFNDQMKWMNSHGTTIYLKLFEGELKRRLLPELSTRPLLKNLDEDTLDQFIYKTLRERAYFYHQATIIIDPLQLSIEELAPILKKDYL